METDGMIEVEDAQGRKSYVEAPIEETSIQEDEAQMVEV